MDSKSQISGKLSETCPNGRVSSGISGLDKMLNGGFPQGHIVVAMGDPGTGKTTLALQYIHDGLDKGESCIYISIEEEKESLISTAASYGWDLQEYIENNKLEFLKLDLSDIKTLARRIRVELPELIESSGASRIAIDSISLFNIMFDNSIESRIRLVDLNKTVKKSGVTALYTSEIGMKNSFHSRDGIIEYSADGILFLQQSEIGSDIRLVIRIIKMRRTLHDRLYRPYDITENAITVYPTEMVFQDEGPGV
ncbi:MAG: KaiC domain-containing protein [ANME-2 cluster archaeon]|nr:KaiC domain-containing protein [ANME-2 cluster archaeon]